jgi:hypothetical protein
LTRDILYLLYAITLSSLRILIVSDNILVNFFKSLSITHKCIIMEMSLSKMTIEEYREYFIDLMKCFHLLTNYRLICDCVVLSSSINAKEMVSTTITRSSSVL